MKNGYQSGGPIRIKVDKTSSPYLGFATEQLAKYAVVRKGIKCTIISSKVIGSKEYPELRTDINEALIFDSFNVLDQYFNNTNTFNYKGF